MLKGNIFIFKHLIVFEIRPPPKKSAVTDEKSGKIQMLNFGNALTNYSLRKFYQLLESLIWIVNSDYKSSQTFLIRSSPHERKIDLHVIKFKR